MNDAGDYRDGSPAGTAPCDSIANGMRQMPMAGVKRQPVQPAQPLPHPRPAIQPSKLLARFSALLSTGLAVSQLAGYWRMNSRAFSTRAFSQAS